MPIPTGPDLDRIKSRADEIFAQASTDPHECAAVMKAAAMMVAKAATGNGLSIPMALLPFVTAVQFHHDKNRAQMN